MPQQEYSPIDYKITDSVVTEAEKKMKLQIIQESQQVFRQEIKKIIIVFGAILLFVLYLLYDANQQIAVLEQIFKKQLSEHQKKIELLNIKR